MRIIWIINIPIHIKEIGYSIENKVYGGGWLEGAYTALKNLDIDIKLIFPDKSAEVHEAYETIVYRKSTTRVSKGLIRQFVHIFERNKPEVIHVWGTEFAHSYAAIKAAQLLGIEDRVIISIQGMVSVYAIHYMAGVPIHYRMGWSVNEFMHFTSLICQQYKFFKRGKLEEKAIREVKWVIGRTEWDRACVYKINSKLEYMHCNENLREAFYHVAKWNKNTCNKHTIFFSQAHYPIKGLHCLLRAMPIIINKYPDTRLVIAGEEKCFRHKIRMSSYDRYIDKICKKYKLYRSIQFTGKLDAEQMVEQYLKANVFVCASSIENSPNSVGEAMILGCPVVAADVGGMKNLITHGVDGYIYPWDEIYMMSFYIMEIFGNSKIVNELSENAIKKGSYIHDRFSNTSDLLKIYDKVIRSK